MKDFLIVYSSKTGNTEKLQEIYEAGGERCDLAAVKQVPAVDDYKVILLVTGSIKVNQIRICRSFYRLWITKKLCFFKL